jgi:hypothetical protein
MVRSRIFGANMIINSSLTKFKITASQNGMFYLKKNGVTIHSFNYPEGESENILGLELSGEYTLLYDDGAEVTLEEL